MAFSWIMLGISILGGGATNYLGGHASMVQTQYYKNEIKIQQQAHPEIINNTINSNNVINSDNKINIKSTKYVDVDYNIPCRGRIK